MMIARKPISIPKPTLRRFGILFSSRRSNVKEDIIIRSDVNEVGGKAVSRSNLSHMFCVCPFLRPTRPESHKNSCQHPSRDCLWRWYVLTAKNVCISLSPLHLKRRLLTRWCVANERNNNTKLRGSSCESEFLIRNLLT